MRRILVSLIAISLLLVPVLVYGQNGAFSAVQMHPQTVAFAKAHGKPIKSPEPLTANQGRKFDPGGQTVGQLTTASEQKILVIFVDFPDAPLGGPAERIDLKNFDDMLFGDTYFPDAYIGIPGAPNDRTLKNFYLKNSYGKVHVGTDNMPSTLGWTTMPHPYSYYVNNDNGYGKVGEMILTALQQIHTQGKVDFSKYAVEGEVPNIFVVHAGSGAEWNGDPNLFWSHSWNLDNATGGGPYFFDGVKVSKYALMPEVGGDTTQYSGWEPFFGTFPPTVGVYAHEFGHVLGVPDQYDYGYESEGTGPFSLMAGGSWNQFPINQALFGGNSPSNFDAWSKYRLGFVTPIEIAGATSVTLPPSETDATVYKMVVPFSGGKEYYLLENRQHIGFDQGLRYNGSTTHGLAIYHIDEVVMTNSYWRPNEAENWKSFRSLGWKKAWTGETHYGISLIQADGFYELERGARFTNFPYSGDLYPGKWLVMSFDSFTEPNSSSYYFWNGSDPKYGYSGVTVKNIVEEVGGNVTADLSFVPWDPK